MKLSRWQHGLLSLLILIGLSILVYTAAIRPGVSSYHARQEQLSILQQRLDKYRAVASQKDTLEPYYKKQINKNKTGNQSFLPLMAASLAAAKLQEKVKSLLKGTPGQLISTQPVPVQDEGIFKPVIVRVHMKSDITTLLKVLHNLEAGKPLAFIDNLQIQRTGPVNNKRRSHIQTDRSLDTRFDLKVYMLKGHNDVKQ